MLGRNSSRENFFYDDNTTYFIHNETFVSETTTTEIPEWYCDARINHPMGFQTCFYILYGLVFVVALTGNGLVCFVVQNSPRMKTVTNYFIANLAIGDILMTLLCVPFTFVSTLVLRYWPFGAVMCKLVNYSQAVSVFVSAYTLVAISIDRYMVIMRPLKPRLGKASAKMIVAGVWGIALATAAPIPVVSQIQRPTYWHNLCNLDFCLEHWDNPEHSEQYSCALLVLQFVLPLCALVCTYARIGYAVWGGRPPGEAQTVRDSRLMRSKKKMIKMMVTVIAVFTVCWLPLNIFIIFYITHEEDSEWGVWPGMPYVWFASHWLAMSHSCYNPIIYCYMNARYRHGFKQALGNVKCFQPCVPARWRHHPSGCDRVVMSELVGLNNGITRRGTISTGMTRLHRAPTCSSCSSVRRMGRGAPPTTSSAAGSLKQYSAPTVTSPPVRAVSVRTHFA